MPTLIPASAAPFFQEYILEKLDLDRDSPLVIERILTYGNRFELHWLFHYYEIDKIKQWIIDLGDCRLPRRRYNLWCAVFDLSPVEKVNPADHQIWQY